MERLLYATVFPCDEGKKIKDFLRSKWRISAALLIALKKYEDGITVNRERVNVSYSLRTGDLVCISIGDHGADSGFEATEMPLDILYEDSDLIVLNKPPFLPVHPSKGHISDTLANGLTCYFHGKGETFVSRCVLRLDRNTSGAVLFAKNAYAHDQLRRQLDNGEIKKEYLALVRGTSPYEGTINEPVYRPAEATVRRVVDPRGKPSKTEYRTEKSDGNLSLLRVFPRTGRTHQIRLHLSHIGAPIVSDFLYGEENDGVLERHGLHCSSLSFSHPVTGKFLCINAPLAEDMKEVCNRLFPVARYHTLDFYLKQTFGEKLVKISLNGGFSCPNRQGNSRGCSFCSAGGSGEFASGSEIPIPEQLKRAKALLSKKWSGYRYIAYFQAYTNTYAPISRLQSTFQAALSDDEVAVLSIATRPDCLSEEILNLLSELNQIKPIWVELGLQTSHDFTASRINRGYPRAVYVTAAEQLRKRAIPVITHLIFGLPGETREQMLSSVDFVAPYSDGVKIQMLQILKGSLWGEQYATSPFSLLSREEYVSLVCDAIAHLPQRVVIHRITGDPPADLLIAPQWTSDKKRVLADIDAELNRRKIVQGCNLASK